MTLRRSTFVLLACLFLTLPLAAESLELRSGQILVGDVVLQEGDTLLVHVRYPDQRDLVLEYQDLTPLSLFHVLERNTDPNDVEGRKRLVVYAEAAGLPGAAIAEYRAIAALDPSLATWAKGEIDTLVEQLADEVMEDANALLEAGNPRAALMYFHTVMERYPGTKAAARAKKAIPGAHKLAGKWTEVAEKLVSPEEAPRLLERIQSALAKGDMIRGKVGGHEGRLGISSIQRRALDRAIHYYERAWKDAIRLPVAPDDEALKSRIESARSDVRKRLVDTNLEAASIQLQRRSIPKAEDYCNRACELAPESKKAHEIHRLILEAKAYGY